MVNKVKNHGVAYMHASTPAPSCVALEIDTALLKQALPDVRTIQAFGYAELLKRCPCAFLVQTYWVCNTPISDLKSSTKINERLPSIVC